MPFESFPNMNTNKTTEASHIASQQAAAEAFLKGSSLENVTVEGVEKVDSNKGTVFATQAETVAERVRAAVLAGKAKAEGAEELGRIGSKGNIAPGAAEKERAEQLAKKLKEGGSDIETWTLQ